MLPHVITTKIQYTQYWRFRICYLSILYVHNPCQKYQADKGVIQVLPDTLVPVSLVGLCTKAVGLTFSGWVGGQVDITPRLAFIRRAIVCQKVRLVAVGLGR
jgi:hypothetical protein